MIMKCLQNAHFIALKTLFRNLIVSSISWDTDRSAVPMMWLLQRLTGSKKFLGMALSDGDCHGGRHFPKQGGLRTKCRGEMIKSASRQATSTGFSPVAPKSAPALSMAAVAVALVPDGIQFTVGQLLFTEAGSHKTADSAALTVNYYDFHKSSI